MSTSRFSSPRRWIALALLAATPWARADPAADRLLQHARDRPDGKDWISQVNLVLRGPQGQERSRKLLFLKKQQGADEIYTMYFSAPADVRGVAFVSVNRDERASRDDDMWMHLPASRQTRRIAANDKRGAFMGSQFSYYDIEKLRVSDFQQSITGTERILDRDTLRVERTPASPATIEKSGYSKVVMWVDPATNLVLQQHLFDERGVLKKILRIQHIERIDGYWTPTDIEVLNQTDGRSSRMEFRATRYDQGLADSLFMSAQLSNGASFERLLAGH